MAAQADVVFRMAADVGNAISALQEIEKQLAQTADESTKASREMAEAGSGMSDAFKTAAAALAGMFTGQALFAAFKSGLSTVGDAAVAFARDSVQAYEEAEVAQARLVDALGSRGEATLENLRRLQDAATDIARSTNLSDEQVMGVQQLGLRFAKTAEQADALARAAIDMSSALGMDVETAARMLGQSLDGDAGKLAQLIPELNGVSEAAFKSGAAISVAADKFRGAAEGEAQTLSGKIGNLKESFGELQEAFGKGLVLGTDAVGQLGPLTDALNNAQDAAVGLGYVIGEAIPMAIGGLVDMLPELLGVVARAIAPIPGVGKVISVAFEAAAIRVKEDVATIFTGLSGVGNIVSQLQDIRASLRQTHATSVEGGDGGGEKKITDAQKLGEEFAKLVNLNESLRNIGADVYATDAERLDVVRAQLAATETLGDKIKRAILEGTLTQEEGDAMLAPLKTSLGDFFLQVRQDAIANGAAGLEDVPDVPISDGGPNMFAQYGNSDALDAMEREAEMRQQLIDLGFTQAEATQLAAEATEREANAHSVAFLAMQKSEQAQRRAWATKIQFRQATMASVAALAQEALAGTLSAQSLLKAGLQYLAEWAGKKSIASFAQSADEMAAYTASHGTDAPMLAAATQHMHAGTMWGVLAAGAGVAAAAVGSGGGGAGGNGGGGREGGEDELTSFGNTRRSVTQPAEAGPRVAVYFTGGVVAGTSPEEFSRLIQPYIEQTVAEAGNRSSSRRG